MQFAQPSSPQRRCDLFVLRLRFRSGRVAGDSSLSLIPGFQMPPVSPAGPLYFYGAMFEPGTLSLETLVSNGSVWEFSLE